MKSIDNKTLNFSRVVIKQQTKEYVGVERLNLSNYQIGMVLSGEKCIHIDDTVVKVRCGDIFFLGLGLHFVEDIPTHKRPYEQIVFSYSSMQLQHSIMPYNDLLLNVGSVDLSQVDKRVNISTSTPSQIVRAIFLSVDAHYRSLGFLDDSVSGLLKLAELANGILRHEQSDILNHFLRSMDSERASFEAVIYRNIFCDKSIKELSIESSRSQTSFKKDFGAYFGTPPHQWYQQQRLSYAQFLLRMTDHTIAYVGEMCMMPNPSHFIKIFKRSFGVTPATYRAQNSLSAI